MEVTPEVTMEVIMQVKHLLDAMTGDYLSMDFNVICRLKNTA